MQHKHIAKRFWKESRGLALNPEALARYNDVIDLSIGDTDFITDSRIIDAAFADAKAGHTRYGDPKGNPELIQAVCRSYKEDFGLDIGPENVFISASSCMGMTLAMAATLDPGDEVLVFSPYFNLYKAQIEFSGGVLVEVPTSQSDGYALSEEAIRAAITPRTRAIIFNNPCNPTGAAYGMKDLTLLARIACEYDLIVAADEIYTRYMFEEEFIPLCSLPGMMERTITLNSCSKNFMMTGWRVGFVVGAPHFIRTVQRINNSMVYSAPVPSQRAAIKALELREEIQNEYISQYKQRVYYAADRVERIPYMTLSRPRGTFYLFPNISKTGLTSVEFCDRLLNEAHIIASPGIVFGKYGEGHIRLVCTVDMPQLKEAFDRMERLTF